MKTYLSTSRDLFTRCRQVLTPKPRAARPESRRPHVEPLEGRIAPAVMIAASNVDSLAVGGDVDGDGLFDPGDTIQYTINITNSGTTDATGVSFADNEDANTTLVGGSVKITPIAFDDAYSLTGNTPITISAGAGVLANDIDPDSTTPLSNVGVTAVGLDVTGTAGSVVLNADGSFTFTPNTGFTGSTSFKYTARDAGSLDSVVTGTVSLNVTGLVWYVDSAYAGGGNDGSFNKPFTTLSPLSTGGDPDGPGNTIFVYDRGGSYSGGLTLENTQTLRGDGAAFSVNGMAIGASANNTVFSTGASTALTLASGNTVSGVNLTTTTGTGLSGSSFGAATISGVTISSTGGAAINLNTGSGTLAFTSVSATGGTNGIVLTNVTATSFTVNGDGLMTAGGNASGGTIQNTTGDAIVLNGASNVTLRNMTITNPAGHGINADNLTGVNLFQSLTVQNFDTVNTDGITVDQTVNFTSITLDKSLFTDAGAHGGNDGFRFVALSGSSAAGTVNVTASEFTELDGDGIQINNDGGGTINTTITGNNLHTADTTGGGNFNTLSVNLTGNGVVNATIGGAGALGNTLNDVARVSANDGALHVAVDGPAALGGADLNAVIENNTISNIPERRGIHVVAAASAANHTLGHDITIKDNKIDNITTRQGIYVAITGSAGFDNQNVDLSITGNLIGTGAVPGTTAGNIGTSGRPGINVEVFDDNATAGTALETDILLQNNQVRVNNTGDVVRIEVGAIVAANTANVEATVLGNTFTNDNAGGDGFQADVGFFVGGLNTFSLDLNSANVPANRNSTNRTYVLNHDKATNAGTVFNVEVQAGDLVVNTAGATYNDAQVETFFNARNTGTVTTPGNNNDFKGAAAVTLPLLAIAPPMPMPVAVANTDAGVSSGTAGPAGSDTGVAPADAGSGVITQAELDGIVTAAIGRWTATGLTAAQAAAISSVTVAVADMPGWYLGAASPGLIQIDSNAGGWGWFIDHTPQDDCEFQGGASPGDGSASRVDLLTAVMHELGHVLGLEDTYDPADQDSVMYGYGAAGERHLPADGQADGATPGKIGHEEFLIGPVSLGTLPAGKTVRVLFQTSINSLTNGLAPTLSNQGTVSGSNFSNVLTDDPAAGGAADPTTTTLDSLTLGNQVWIETNGNSVFNSGTDTGANPIALTLFLSDGTTVVTTGSTNGSGVYQFTGLLPGDYIVRVDASNFGAAQTLNGKVSISGAVDPDDNIDNDDNGVDNAAPATNGIRSLPITLAYNTEPVAGVGNDTNTTLDFGFLSPPVDLQITKTDGVATKVPGTSNTYTIVVTNAGPNSVTGATIADTFPASFTGATFTASATGGATGFGSGSGNLNQTVNMPNGSTITYVVTGNIAPGATGTLDNTATVTAPATVTDTNTANNTALDSDTLTPQVDFGVTKTDGTGTVASGSANTYTIVVSNSGPSTATGVNITDNFPANFTGVAYTAAGTGGASGFANGASNISQTLTLPPGSMVTYTATGTVGAAGSLTNTVTLTGANDTNNANNSATDTDTIIAPPPLTATKVDLLLTDVDLDGVADPGDTLKYTVVITNTSGANLTGVTFSDLLDPNTTLIGSSVNVSPLAINDVFTAIGNTTLVVGAPAAVSGPAKTQAGSATANDFEFLSDTFTVSSFQATSAQGGTVSMVTSGANMGSFSYLPAVGFTGTDTFTYTLRDDGIDGTPGNADDLTGTGTVTVTVSEVVWYVDASAAGGGTGRSNAPFNTITATNLNGAGGAGDLDAANHYIYLAAGTYNGGFVLESGQHLIGAGSALVVGGSTLAAAGTRPTLAHNTGSTLALSTGNEVRGLNFTNSAGSGLTGSAVGTLTLADFDVTVTGGSALSVTTSGTITATGADNDLNSTNGTALNVNAVNIGAAGLTFKSISAGAGANVGINLISTGASGGLTVTGLDGADAGTDADPGTGGTIAGKTGADGSTTSGIGIFLSDTRNVSLAGMQLNDHQNFAIRGTSVTGFTLAASILNGTHGAGAVAANDEGAISFTNLFGSAAITNSTVANTNAAGGAEAVLRVVNNSGTLDRLTISGSTISNSNAVPGIGDDGMYFESQNSAVMKLTISNSHFTASRADLIQTNALNSSTMDIVVTGTEFKNNNSAILSGGGGTLFSGGGTGSTATVTFNISGNTFRDARGHALGVFKGTGTANFSGTISNNTVGVAGVANSGTLDSSADISVESLGAGTMTVLISGNTLRQYNEEGIRIFANTGSSVLNATVIGNTVTEPGNIGAFSGVYAAVGGVAGDTATVNLLLGSFGTPANQNSLVGSDPTNTNDVYLENQGATTTFNLSRGGSAAGTVAGVVQDDNVGNPTVATAGTITLVAGNPPTPLLFAPTTADPVAPAGDAPVIVPTAIGSVASVMPPPVIVDDGLLSQAELDSLVGAAIARWEATGLTAEQSALLHRVTFAVADMPGWYLGSAGDGVVTLDSNAAGNAWFIDPTPLDDAEFESGSGVSPEVLHSRAGSPSHGRVDALTTVVHELGHQLGLDDTYASADRANLMYGFINQGERRLPAAHQADGATPHLTGESSPDFLFTPINIGTLPVGKSVTVVFNATINNSIPASATQVANQGFVEFTGGPVGGVPTNDPDTGAQFDATVTLVPQADLQITKTDDIDPILPGNTLTYTIVAKNNGPTAVTGATIADTFPANLTNLNLTSIVVSGGASSPHATGAFAGTLTDTVNLPSGGMITYTVTATANTAGLASNTATITTPTIVHESNAANNTATQTTVVGGDDLSITKTDGLTSAVPGTAVTYTIVVANSAGSSLAANGAMLADTFPVTLTNLNLTNIAATGGAMSSHATGAFSGTLTDTITALPIGSTLTYTVTGTISAAATGSLANTATITAPGGFTDTNATNNSATDTDTLTPQGDLQITKTDGPAKTTAVPGTPNTYTIVVTNAGPSNVVGATVADTFPGIFTGVNFTAMQTGGATGFTASGAGNINDTTVNMPAGSTITYTVTGNISPTATGSLSNTATITAPGGFTNLDNTNDSATDTDTLTPQADLQITKTDSSDPVLPNSTLTYTVVVKNVGPSSVTSGSTVSDTFPASLSSLNLVSITPAGGASSTHATGAFAGTFTDSTVNLPTGSQLTYVFTATTGATPGSISNTATVAAPVGVDPDTANNSATQTTQVGGNDLGITKTDGSATAVPGTTVTYTIVVSSSNASQITATGATVSDTFPASLSNLNLTSVVTTGGATSPRATGAFSGTFSDTVNLPINSTITYTVTGLLGAAATGSLTNTATVTGPAGFNDVNAANDSATDTDTLTPQADLAITKTDGVTSVVPGQGTTYTIVVSNSGPSTATGVSIADTFPAILTGTTYTATASGSATGFTPSGGGNLNDAAVVMAPGSSITYTVMGTVNPSATGTLSNTATVSAASDTTPANNSATDTDTLTPQTNVSVTKTDGTTTAVPGGSTTYMIVVSNSGPSTATATTLTDTFPASITGATWTSVAAGGATGNSAGPVAGNISEMLTLLPGSTVTYTVAASIAAGATGSLTNTATVSQANDTTPANNSATDTDTLTPQADLTITKTDGATTAVPGGSVTYTITVSNAGLSNVTGATVADTFPASLSGVTWTSVGAGGGMGTAAGSGNINDTVTLPSGGSVTYTVSGTIDPAATGTLSNTATITAPGGVTDPTPANNSATDTDTLTPQADLSITKTDGVTTAVPGGSVTYTITVSNSGLSNVIGATVADTFPASLSGVTWTSVGAGGGMGTASGNGNINDTVTLPVGGSVTYTVSGDISASATGTLSNTATIAAPGGVTDLIPGNNSATDSDTLTRQSDLSITKTDSPDPVGPGTQLTYTIVVANAGPSDNTSATITDTFPAGLSSVTWTAAFSGGGSGNLSGTGNISEIVTGLAAGQSVTYTVTGTVTAAANTTISNTASLTSAEDTNIANNSAMQDTFVGGVDLKLTKAGDVAALTPGQVIKYTLSYRNGGFITANGVNIGDTIPANTVFDLANSTAGWQDSGGMPLADGATAGTAIKYPIGSLPVSAMDATVVLAVKVKPTVAAGAATIDNTAMIADNGASGADLTPADNTAMASTTLNAAPDLQLVSKSDGTTFTLPGSVLTYAINFKNNGNQDATGTVLTEIVPAGSTIHPDSIAAGWVPGMAPGTFIFTVGALAGGGTSGSTTFKVTVDAPVPPGQTTVVNSVNIDDDHANDADPTPNNTATDSDFLIAAPGVGINILNPYVATYTDVDGDLVMVRVTKPILDALDFQLAPSGLGFQLVALLFSDDVTPRFNLTIGGRPQDVTNDGIKDGNGLVNVGRIDAAGIELGGVNISGDLGEVDAGKGSGLAIQTLNVGSLGKLGTTTGSPDLHSSINGKLGRLVVRGDVLEAHVDVAGDIGAFQLVGSLIGGTAANSGKIHAGGSIGSGVIAGDVLGGSGPDSGRIEAGTNLTRLIINGSLRGGTASGSGSVIAGGALHFLTIHGDLIGGMSGAAMPVSDAGSIQAKHIGNLGVDGSIIGGVNGGGGLTRSGSVHADDDISSMVVKGNILGSQSAPVVITARGQAAPPATSDLALRSLTVGGNVTWADFQLGFDKNSVPRNADAQLNSATIGGDWIASNLRAGVDAVDGQIGDANDTRFAGVGIKDTAVFSRLASIVIKGNVSGTAAPTSDRFGFAAEHVGAFKVHGIATVLAAGARTDTFALGAAKPVGTGTSTGTPDGLEIHVFEV